MQNNSTFSTGNSRSGVSPGPGKAGRARSRKRPIARQTRALRSAAGAGEVCGSIAAGTGVAARDSVALSAYAEMTRELRTRYKISIRKWRSDMAGVAYELTYQDGRIKRLIAAPRPKSPVSAAIFLHEVGHHAIGFRRYAQRCLEEHYVWQWTFREMALRGIAITPRVMRHYRRSMYHYVKGAQGRAEHVPGELGHFGCWPG